MARPDAGLLVGADGSLQGARRARLTETEPVVTQPASVRVTVWVGVDAARAFEVFTGEIDDWYRRGPHNFFDPVRAIAIRLEPWVGGRLLEVYDNESGEAREMARVLAWEPAARLLLRDTRDTEIEVT